MRFFNSILVLLFCFNPVVLIAHEAMSPAITISRQEADFKEQDELSSAKEPNNEKSAPASGANSHKYRPKMYRKIAGGFLFGIGVIGTIVAIYTSRVFLAFIAFGGIGGILPFLGCFCTLLVLPVTGCVLGLKLLDSE